MLFYASIWIIYWYAKLWKRLKLEISPNLEYIYPQHMKKKEKNVCQCVWAGEIIIPLKSEQRHKLYNAMALIHISYIFFAFCCETRRESEFWFFFSLSLQQMTSFSSQEIEIRAWEQNTRVDVSLRFIWIMPSAPSTVVWMSMMMCASCKHVFMVSENHGSLRSPNETNEFVILLLE